MAKKRCLKRRPGKTACLKWAKSKSAKRGKAKSCRFGVSKTTGKCLKTKRARKR